MMVSNIERFDEVVAKTFATLYENFPVPVFLPAGEFGITQKQIDDAAGLSFPPEIEIVFSSIRWLADSGYIKYEREVHVGFMQVVLTAQGLAALKATPASLTSGRTVGEQLAESVKTGAKDAASEAVKSVLGQGLVALGKGVVALAGMAT